MADICIEHCTYTHGRLTPQSIEDALNTATPNVADGHPHQSIEHVYLEYCYTKLGRWTPCQSSIDALNTITPNLADGPPSIQHRCLVYCYTKLSRWTPHQLSIDALNTTTPNLADGPPSIQHRCLVYCYTKLSRWTPHQLSIDALNTTIPNLADGPPQLKLSVTAGQVLADECLKWEPIQNSHLHNNFTLCPALHAVIWCWAIGQVTHTFITWENAAIYVNLKFLFCLWFHIVVVV